MSTTKEAVSRVLDDFHDAAAKADFDRYFGHFTAAGIFLGTDATERWDVNAFKAFARPYFDKGKGWTYMMRERQIYISPDGNTAWFDERLENASLGECRGSGVLSLEDGVWKIAQYNLTIPVPNDLVPDIVDQIRKRGSQKTNGRN